MKLSPKEASHLPCTSKVPRSEAVDTTLVLSCTSMGCSRKARATSLRMVEHTSGQLVWPKKSSAVRPAVSLRRSNGKPLRGWLGGARSCRLEIEVLVMPDRSNEKLAADRLRQALWVIKPLGVGFVVMVIVARRRWDAPTSPAYQ